jgi:thioredoxin-like negative regulator of GroEL
MNADNTQIVEIGETNFESEVLRSKEPVVVAFSAPWSRPCHIIRSVVDEVATECAGRVKVLRVNVDDHPNLALLCQPEGVCSNRRDGQQGSDSLQIGAFPVQCLNWKPCHKPT